MKNKSITFITGNLGKVHELKAHLDYPITHHKLDLPEIQSLDLHDVIETKAKAAYEVINSPVLVEDVSVVYHALGKLPGPFIKWFLEELGNEGICRLLDRYPTRKATVCVAYCYYDGKQSHIFEGSTEGSIADRPRGEHGFGWNPIFIPDGYDKTWGEMTLEERADTSARYTELKKLENYMKSL